MDYVEDTRSRVAYAEVNGVKLKYMVQNKTGESPDLVRVDIRQNDVYKGGMQIKSDGSMYTSFDVTGIDDATKSQIVAKALADAAEIFNE